MRSFLLLAVVVAASSFTFWQFKKPDTNRVVNSAANKSSPGSKANAFKRIQSYAAALKLYTKRAHYNTSYCFLIDMKLPSGSKRFFVYDFKKDTIVNAGLVTHGYGNSSGLNVGFSNIPGSNASSLGIYRIGNSYMGKFGLAFKLFGLDSTNSNAFKRFVVLHSHDCVPENEIAPATICMSQGCPTVAPVFLQSLKGYLENAVEPILLRIYY